MLHGGFLFAVTFTQDDRGNTMTTVTLTNEQVLDIIDSLNDRIEAICDLPEFPTDELFAQHEALEDIIDLLHERSGLDNE